MAFGNLLPKDEWRHWRSTVSANRRRVVVHVYTVARHPSPCVPFVTQTVARSTQTRCDGDVTLANCKLNDRLVAVLRWMGGSCPERVWPDRKPQGDRRRPAEQETRDDLPQCQQVGRELN